MRRAIYDGRVVRLGIEDATLPSGRTTALEIIRHDGAAAVVAVDDAERVVLIRQFRWAAGAELWEIPAGVLEHPAEDPAVCARRELAEEAGLTARELTALGKILPTPGYSTEAIWIFLARDLGDGEMARGADEEISEVRRVPMSDAFRMIDGGEIMDAKTIAALTLAARRMGAWT